MRIAHVITRMILGGAQENTLLTCEDLLREWGDEVLLITGPALGPEGSLLARAAARGVPVEIIDTLRRPIHPWRDARSYGHIRRALRRFRPEVVHTHSAKGGILGRAAAWALHVPAVVHTVHGAPFYPYQPAALRAAYRWCERWAAGRCHALISVADAMTELFVDAGVAPRERFTTIYSGLEVEPLLQAETLRAATRAGLGYEPDDLLIVKIARLAPLKGHDDLIAAAAMVVQHCPRARFLLVGDGVLRARLEQQIAGRGLAGHFQFTGLVPPERVPALLAAADIVVHTSLREGLARALPQALLAGRPVVSYDVDGAREVVLPGRTGMLVPPRQVEALSQALVQLSSDPAARRAWGEEGRRRFAARFDHRRTTAQIRAVYQRLLGPPGTGPS